MKNFIFKKLFANQIRSIGLFDFLKFDEIMIVLDLVADPQLVDGHERVCGRLGQPNHKRYPNFETRADSRARLSLHNQIRERD